MDKMIDAEKICVACGKNEAAENSMICEECKKRVKNNELEKGQV